MKIYKDKAQDTAIVTCTIEELRKMETAFFFAFRHFEKLSKEETENWQAELDMQVASEYASIHDEIANAVREEREAEIEEIRQQAQEALKRKNKENTEE